MSAEKKEEQARDEGEDAETDDEVLKNAQCSLACTS